jgi:hypothetical protein
MYLDLCLCVPISLSQAVYSSCAPGGYRDEDFHVKPPGQTVRTTIPHIFTLRTGHRVDRVLSFLSSRPNWDSPTPSSAGECVSSPPLVPGERGWAVPILTRGQTLWYSRYVCTLRYMPSQVFCYQQIHTKFLPVLEIIFFPFFY